MLVCVQYCTRFCIWCVNKRVNMEIQMLLPKAYTGDNGSLKESRGREMYNDQEKWDPEE